MKLDKVYHSFKYEDRMMKNRQVLCTIIRFGIIFYSFFISYSAYSILGPVTLYNKILLMGAIQYPHVIEKVPIVRVYCSGNRIQCVGDENKKLTFSIPVSRFQSDFYLLITETIEFVTEENVVLYLKVPSNTPYKLYTLQRVPELSRDVDTSNGSDRSKTVYRWNIKENMQLTENGKIPDNAIIVCTDPEHIYGLEGDFAGSDESAVFELPKLIIRYDLLSFVGSEHELHEISNRLLLSSLDYDAIHAAVPQEINHKAKTVVALAT